MLTQFVLTLTVLTQSFPIETLKGLRTHKTAIAAETHQGLAAVRVTEPQTPANGEDKLVVIEGASVGDGVIELEVSGSPGSGAVAGARGFVGIAFRVAPDLSAYDAFYLRPTNGRADDQVRRNHSAQYISFPQWPWERLRKEFPEKYESYVDLQPGVWTKVKVELEGTKARLYVHGNTQPTIVVNGLKGPQSGGVALWIGPGTLAHFRGLRIAK
jgi:hypothetical protein